MLKLKKVLIFCCSIFCIIGMSILFVSAKNKEYDSKSNNIIVEFNKETKKVTTTNSQIDIDYFGNDKELKYIFDELENFIKENPDITDSEIEKFIDSQFRNPIDYYIDGKLNKEEQKLYREDRIKAIKCMMAGKEAIEKSEKLYSWGLHNGNGDAFRHAYWNYKMACDVGPEFAKRWSDAHEDGSEGQLSIEEEMDRFNNGVGLYQYELHGCVSSSKMVEIIQERVRNGGCLIIRDGELVNSDSEGER